MTTTTSRRFAIAFSSAMLAVGLAACGTTAHVPQGVAQTNGLSAPTGALTTGSNGLPGTTNPNLPSGSTLPTGALTGGLTTGVGGSGGVGGNGTSGGSGGSGSNPGGGTSQGGGSQGGGNPLPITNGPGKLAPVEVGIVYVPDADSFSALFGIKTKVGDQLKEATAAVNWVNAHGGLGGHPIVPEYYKQSLLSTAPYATSMAAICSSWTQDHHVVAGLVVGAAATDQLPQCMNANGKVYISGGFYPHDQTTFASMPKLYGPYEPDTGLAEKALLATMLATGKITTKDKVGVLLADNEAAESRTYKNIIEPTLKAKGIKVSAYNVEFPDSTLDAANALKQVTNDQLHMRSDGVTTVLLMAPGGGLTFMKDANNQGWSTKYGFTSIEQPITLANGGNAAVAQLAKATAIGWEPGVDVGAYGSTSVTNSATRLCQSIEGPTGQITDFSSQLTAYEWCDTLLTMQAAANIQGALTSLTSDALAAGYNRLGSRTSAVVFSQSVSAAHHAGANAYRVLNFGTGCKCFTYSGPLVHF